jgi:protein involved in polysaccharide export with SLBB domain
LNRTETASKHLKSNVPRGALLITLAIAAAMPSAASCKSSEDAKGRALQKAAREWIQVGREQHKRSLFKAARKSFQRAAIYRRYLNDADRKKLDGLLEESANAAPGEELTSASARTPHKLVQPIRPVETAKAVPLDAQGVEVKPEGRIIEPEADSIKEGNLLTRREWDYIGAEPEPSTSSRNSMPVAEPKSRIENPQSGIETGITLEPGDVIEIKFSHVPQLNTTQIVRSDGRISLQLIPEVTAQGKTAAELRRELIRLYDPHLRAPEISVTARSLYNRSVFVGGRIPQPGVVEMTGLMTALEAIMEVGGFGKKAAERKNVIVIRYSGGRRYAYKLDLTKAIAGKKTKPFYLKPKDIVHVPGTTTAELNQWIDQHIDKIIPDTGSFLRRTDGNTTVGTDTQL